MRRVKKTLKSVAAVTPLVLSMASPASACLLTGASETAAEKSPQIEKGPMGIGPTAPVSGLHNNVCDGPMCDPSGKFSDHE